VSIGNPLIVGAASIGLAQHEDRERGVDQPHVFDRVARFLAAITARLRSRILGALDAPFGPIVVKRGEAGARAAASASATPRRLANSVKDRVGASPRARSVAPAPPGGERSSGRPGYTTADPRGWAVDSSGTWCTVGRGAAFRRGARGSYGPGTRPQRAGPTGQTRPR
jgi:hypothetical protein